MWHDVVMGGGRMEGGVEGGWRGVKQVPTIYSTNSWYPTTHCTQTITYLKRTVSIGPGHLDDDTILVCWPHDLVGPVTDGGLAHQVLEWRAIDCPEVPLNTSGALRRIPGGVARRGAVGWWGLVDWVWRVPWASVDWVWRVRWGPVRFAPASPDATYVCALQTTALVYSSAEPRTTAGAHTICPSLSHGCSCKWDSSRRSLARCSCRCGSARPPAPRTRWALRVARWCHIAVVCGLCGLVSFTDGRISI